MSSSSEYLTIPEALIFTGKSDSTIRRLVKMLASNKSKSGQMTRQNVRLNKTGKSSFYEINKSFLVSYFNLETSQKEDMPDHDTSQNSNFASQVPSQNQDFTFVINTLKELIEQQKETIKEQKGELSEMRVDIRKLTETVNGQNLQLTQLLENEQKIRGGVIAHEVNAQALENEEIKHEKRKRFLWIF